MCILHQKNCHRFSNNYLALISVHYTASNICVNKFSPIAFCRLKENAYIEVFQSTQLTVLKVCQAQISNLFVIAPPPRLERWFNMQLLPTGEPNNKGGNENCGHFMARPHFNFRWNDDECVSQKDLSVSIVDQSFSCQ